MYFVVQGLFSSFVLLLFGYSFAFHFFNIHNCCSIFVKYFISLTLGTGLIAIPTIVWVVFFDYQLNTFFIVQTILLIVISIFLLTKNFTNVKNDVRSFFSVLKRHFYGNIFDRFVVISLIFFIAKSIYFLAIVPINVDALYFYLPSSISFNTLGQVFPFADPPVAQFLYSWSFSIECFFNEPFRQIPLLFILSFPLLVYSISRKFLSKKQAQFSLIFSIFCPILETGTYLWPWHTDFIAGTFTVLTVFFILQPFKFHEFLAGLSLSLAILTKTPYGLIGAILLFTILLVRENKLSVAFLDRKIDLRIIIFFVCLLVVFLFGQTHSFGLVAFMEPLPFAMLTSVFFVALITWNLRGISVNFDLNFFVLILSLLPVLLWIFRQVSLGGSPLALPLFSTEFNDGDWFSLMKSQIITSTSILPFGNIFLLFYHPLLCLTFLPLFLVGIFYVFKIKRLRIIFLIIFLYYFIWFSALSRGAIFRHLYPVLFFIFPVVSLGFSKILEFLKVNCNKITFFSLISLTLLFSIQNISLHFTHQDLQGNPLLPIFSTLLENHPWLYYENPLEVSPHVWLLFYCVIFTILIPVLLNLLMNKIKFNFGNWKFPKSGVSLMLIVYCFVMMFVPITYSVSVTTNGDLSSYATNKSWYKSQIALCDDLDGRITDGSLLTFGFDAFYYLAEKNIVYYDLWHGHLTSFPNQGLDIYQNFRRIIETTNIEVISQELDSLGVTYVLLPTPGAYLYSTYERFNEFYPFFSVLIEHGTLQLEKTYTEANFELYHIEYEKTMYTEEIFSADFALDHSNWTELEGSWKINEETYLGNFSGFGVSVVGDSNWTDIAVEADVLGKEDVRDVGIIFRYANNMNYYRLFISGDLNQLRVLKIVNGSAIYPEDWVRSFSSSPNIWYNLRVLLSGNVFKIYVDHTFIFSIIDPDFIPSGKVGLGGYDEQAVFDNVLVERVFYKNPLG